MSDMSSYLDCSSRGDCDEAYAERNRLQREVDTLTARAAAAEKDAARYQWLVKHASPNQWRYLSLITPHAVNEAIDVALALAADATPSAGSEA